MQSLKFRSIKEKMEILIVDDSQDICEVLSEIIKLEGYDVVTAESGKKALEMIANNTFTAVFLDLGMPGFSGLKVIDYLTKSGSILLNKIIVMTATSISSTELNNLKKNGVWLWMRKPMNLNELQSTLRSI